MIFAYDWSRLKLFRSMEFYSARKRTSPGKLDGNFWKVWIDYWDVFTRISPISNFHISKVNTKIVSEFYEYTDT